MRRAHGTKARRRSCRHISKRQGTGHVCGRRGRIFACGTGTGLQLGPEVEEELDIIIKITTVNLKKNTFGLLLFLSLVSVKKENSQGHHSNHSSPVRDTPHCHTPGTAGPARPRRATAPALPCSCSASSTPRARM